MLRNQCAYGLLAVIAIGFVSPVNGNTEIHVPPSHDAELARSERTGMSSITVPASGISSWDSVGSPNNLVMLLSIGAFNDVTGYGFSVTLVSQAPGSWRSDIRVRISNSANIDSQAFSIAPAGIDGPGGPTSYSTMGTFLKFDDFGLSPISALADGIVRLEFFEAVDDAPGSVDGQWVGGEINLQLGRDIPAPAAFLQIAACSAGLAMTRKLHIVRSREQSARLPAVDKGRSL